MALLFSFQGTISVVNGIDFSVNSSWQGQVYCTDIAYDENSHLLLVLNFTDNVVFFNPYTQGMVSTNGEGYNFEAIDFNTVTKKMLALPTTLDGLYKISTLVLKASN